MPPNEAELLQEVARLADGWPARVLGAYQTSRVNDHDGNHFDTICRLVTRNPPPEGFVTLAYELQRPNLTLEHLVAVTFTGHFPGNVEASARVRLGLPRL